MAAAPDGDPRYAPASYHIDAVAETSVPSCFAPIFITMRQPDVGPVARNTSSRPITIFTGRPDFFDRTIASGSRYTGILPPNPPPISLGITRMFAASRCRMRTRIAHQERTLCRAPKHDTPVGADARHAG